MTEGTSNPTESQPLRAQVLIVDDEVEHGEVMADALRKPGHVCTIVNGLEAAREELLHGSFDVVVTDLVMESETSGLKVLDCAQEHQPDAETILVTAHGDVPTAKAAQATAMTRPRRRAGCAEALGWVSVMSTASRE